MISDSGNRMIYRDADDAKAALTAVIESGAARADGYDVQSIFEETFDYISGPWGSGYMWKVDTDTFWLVVERYSLGDEGVLSRLKVLAGEYQIAKTAAAFARLRVLSAAVLAVESGVSESEAARVSGIDRMTVRKALGK